MNQTIGLLTRRRSHRAFDGRPITLEDRKLLEQATLQAPTAGNMMLYSIIDVTDPGLKERFAILCDNQPMIAKAPLVWIFLADMRKWVNFYQESGTVAKGETKGIHWRAPGLGDLFLAMDDALIAAQSAVTAAESLGMGSCYIGDVLENHEKVSALLQLPPYTAIAAMVIFGYPKNPDTTIRPTLRCAAESIFMENTYREAHLEALQKAFGAQEEHLRSINAIPKDDWATISDYYYFRKYQSGFMDEMNRSVSAAIFAWKNPR